MRDFFRKNLGLKLMSVAIALSLEIYFISPQNLVTETINATVELQDLPRDRVVVSPVGASEGITAECKIRGPGPIIQEIKEKPRKFVIAFPLKLPTTYVANLDPLDLRLPAGVELLEIKPPRFEFKIEDLIKKQMKVLISTTGLLRAGLKLDEIKPTIETVVASGPRGELSGIESVETEDIDIGQYKGSTEIDVALKPISSRVTFDRPMVHVTLKIVPRDQQSREIQ